RKLIDDFRGELPREIDPMLQLPGVGRKTAAMVLGNAFGLQQGIAVDTHVKRVAQRLALSAEKNVDKIERDFREWCPSPDKVI
ncbi:endonuclease III, partial [candidate division KSB1 bacterium 4484_188]